MTRRLIALSLVALPVPALAAPVICPVAAAPQAGATARSIDEAARRIWSRHDAIPGMSVAVVQGGRLVYACGFGLADVASRAAVDPGKTLFRIGSLTKLFTYTTALRLVADGQLTPDADINRYLGDAALPAAGLPPVRLRDLFTHRAGFEDAALGHAFMGKASAVPSLRDYILHDRPARIWPAGTATAYSNYGVALLGYIAERQTHLPYATLVERQILGPLGMASTSLAEPVADGEPVPHGRMPPMLAARAATGYAPWFGQLRPFPHEHIHPAAAPAGSAFSTATDMACFMQAALGHGPAPFPPAIRQTFAQRPYGDRGALPDYAHGFIAGRYGALPTLSHGGAMGGFRAGMTLLPTLDTGIFVAANAASGGRLVDAVQSGIMAALAPQASTPPPPAASGDFANRWSPLTGAYLTRRRSWHHLETVLLLDGSGNASVAIDPAGFLLIATGDGKPERFAEIGPRLFRAGQKTAFFPGKGQADDLYIDVKSYARTGWADRTGAMLWLRGIAALGGVGAFAALIRLPRRRWSDGLLAACGLSALAVAGTLALALSDADGRGEFLVYDWPTEAITLLRATAILAGVLPIPAGLAAWCHRRRLGLWRVSLVVFSAMSSALLVAGLAHWNLFAPAS